jgi:hypothetical protein
VPRGGVSGEGRPPGRYYTECARVIHDAEPQKLLQEMMNATEVKERALVGVTGGPPVGETTPLHGRR